MWNRYKGHHFGQELNSSVVCKLLATSSQHQWPEASGTLTLWMQQRDYTLVTSAKDTSTHVTLPSQPDDCTLLPHAFLSMHVTFPIPPSSHSYACRIQCILHIHSHKDVRSRTSNGMCHHSQLDMPHVAQRIAYINHLPCLLSGWCGATRGATKHPSDTQPETQQETYKNIVLKLLGPYLNTVTPAQKRKRHKAEALQEPAGNHSGTT